MECSEACRSQAAQEQEDESASGPLSDYGTASLRQANRLPWDPS